jgi:hypothetical protein
MMITFSPSPFHGEGVGGEVKNSMVLLFGMNIGLYISNYFGKEPHLFLY